MMLKSKKGFTLIELIVALAIFSINSFNNINESLYIQSQVSNIMEKIKSNLKFADNISIIEDENSVQGTKGLSYIFTEDGSYKETDGEQQVYSINPETENISYNVSFHTGSGRTLKITVTATKDGETVYSLDTNVLLNNLSSATILGLQQGNAIRFIAVGSESQAPSIVKVTSILVSSPSDSISQADGTLQMNAAVNPANATDKTYTWSVFDLTGSATIDSLGILTAVGNGTVTVKATANDGSNITGQKVITVGGQNMLVQSISLSGAGGKTSVKRNNSLQINATVLPAEAANKAVTWSVDNINYATINQSGLLTAKSTYNVSVIVTATAQDGSGVVGTITISITKN